MLEYKISLDFKKAYRRVNEYNIWFDEKSIYHFQKSNFEKMLSSNMHVTWAVQNDGKLKSTQFLKKLTVHAHIILLKDFSTKMVLSENI